MKPFKLLQSAERELQNSVQFYNHKIPGLGDRLLTDFGAVMDRLGRYPESGPLILKHFRGAGLRDFPYNVVYRIEPGHILVVAVAHQSREFGYWKDRV